MLISNSILLFVVELLNFSSVITYNDSSLQCWDTTMVIFLINTKEVCAALSLPVLFSSYVPDLWCVSCVFCISISLPSPAPWVWLLTFSSLHGWSGYWLDLGTECTNIEIRRERGSQADMAAVPTPLHSPALPLDTKRKKKNSVLRHSTPTEQTPRHATWTLIADRIRSKIQSQQSK